jgi:hypothetical protein
MTRLPRPDLVPGYLVPTSSGTESDLVPTSSHSVPAGGRSLPRPDRGTPIGCPRGRVTDRDRSISISMIDHEPQRTPARRRAAAGQTAGQRPDAAPASARQGLESAREASGGHDPSALKCWIGVASPSCTKGFSRTRDNRTDDHRANEVPQRPERADGVVHVTSSIAGAPWGRHALRAEEGHEVAVGSLGVRLAFASALLGLQPPRRTRDPALASCFQAEPAQTAREAAATPTGQTAGQTAGQTQPRPHRARGSVDAVNDIAMRFTAPCLSGFGARREPQRATDRATGTAARRQSCPRPTRTSEVTR